MASEPEIVIGKVRRAVGQGAVQPRTACGQEGPAPPARPPARPLQHGERRLKGKEMTIPIVLGTIAFYLGKKVPPASASGLFAGGVLGRGGSQCIAGPGSAALASGCAAPGASCVTSAPCHSCTHCATSCAEMNSGA